MEYTVLLSWLLSVSKGCKVSSNTVGSMKRREPPLNSPLMWGSQQMGDIFLSAPLRLHHRHSNPTPVHCFSAGSSTLLPSGTPPRIVPHSPSSDQQHPPGGSIYTHPPPPLPRAAHVQLLNDRHRLPLCALPAAQTNAAREAIGYTAGDLKSLRLLSFGDEERLCI